MLLTVLPGPIGRLKEYQIIRGWPNRSTVTVPTPQAQVTISVRDRTFTQPTQPDTALVNPAHSRSNPYRTLIALGAENEGAPFN